MIIPKKSKAKIASNKVQESISLPSGFVTSVAGCGNCQNDKLTSEQQRKLAEAKNKAVCCTEEFLSKLKSNPSSVNKTLQEWFGFTYENKDKVEELVRNYESILERMKNSALCYTPDLNVRGQTGKNPATGEMCPETRIGTDFWNENFEMQAKTIIHENVHGALGLSGRLDSSSSESYILPDPFDRYLPDTLFPPKHLLISESNDGKKSRSSYDPKFGMKLPDAYGLAALEDCNCSA